MHDLNKLVPVVVLGEKREFLGRVGPVLGLAHEDGGGVDPKNRVVAGDGRERKIGPTLGIEDGEQPLHVSNRRFEKVRDLSKIGGGGIENTWRSTPLGTLEVLGHVSNDLGQIGLWSGAFDPGEADRRRLRERLDRAGQIGEDSVRSSFNRVRSKHF
ncbi:hypothetical protein FCV25MIE_28008 [Fagus crenata]